MPLVSGKEPALAHHCHVADKISVAWWWDAHSFLPGPEGKHGFNSTPWRFSSPELHKVGRVTGRKISEERTPGKRNECCIVDNKTCPLDSVFCILFPSPFPLLILCVLCVISLIPIALTLMKQWFPKSTSSTQTWLLSSSLVFHLSTDYLHLDGPGSRKLCISIIEFTLSPTSISLWFTSYKLQNHLWVISLALPPHNPAPAIWSASPSFIDLCFKVSVRCIPFLSLPVPLPEFKPTLSFALTLIVISYLVPKSPPIHSSFKQHHLSKIQMWPWPVWLSWLQHCAVHWKVAGSIPDQVTYVGYGFDPWSRCLQVAIDWCSSLALMFLSLPPFLSLSKSSEKKMSSCED